MSWFTRHGIGVNTTTYSVLPIWKQRTKTPKAEKESLTGPKNETPKYPSPKKSLLSKLGIGKGSRAESLEDNEGTAAAKPQLVSKDKTKFTHSLDHTFILQDKKYFGELQDYQKRALNVALSQVMTRLKDTSDLPIELCNGDKAVLTQALAEVSKVPGMYGVEGAVRGLACLQNINMFESICHPGEATADSINTAVRNDAAGRRYVPCPAIGARADGQYDYHDVNCAWRLAQTLAKTPIGFQLLKKITIAPGFPNNLDNSVKRHYDAMLHVFLDGAREMAQVAMRANPNQATLNDPNALYDAIISKLQPPLNNEGQPDVEQQENPGKNGAPTSARRGEELHLLEKGMLALRDHLRQAAAYIAEVEENNARAAQGRDVEAMAPFNIPPARLNGNAWAIGMIRNGIYTDELRDNRGKPTRFALIQGRIEKIARTTQAVYSRPENQWQRLAKTVKRLVVPYKNKSPLRAYNNLGKGNDAIGFLQSEKVGGISEGRTVKQNLMANVMKGLRTQGGGEDGQPAPLNLPIQPRVDNNGRNIPPNERTLKSLVRLAILEETNTTLFLPRYKDGDRLNDFDVDRAKQRAYAYLRVRDDAGREVAGNEENLGARTLEAITRLFKLENKGCTPETLVEWARDVGGPATVEEAVLLGRPNQAREEIVAGDQPDQAQEEIAAEDQPDQAQAQGEIVPEGQPNQQAPVAPAPRDGEPNWSEFGQGIDFVVNSAVQLEGTPNLTRDGNRNGVARNEEAEVASVAERFRQAIEGQELGSRFSFSSGGIVGGSTAGLTQTVTGMATWGSVLGKLDCTYNRARTAVFEAGTSTSGNEIVIATETLNRKKFGVGGGIGLGPVPAIPANVMVSGDVGLAHDGINRRGSVLRFDRTETGGVIGDAENNKKLGEVAEMILSPGAVEEGNEDRNSIIKRLLQEHPRLSIGWMGNDEGRWSEFAAANASPGFGIGRFRVNMLTAGASIQGSQSNHKWREQGGWLHVEKNTKAVSVQAGAAVSGPNAGAAITPVPPISGTDATARKGLGGAVLGGVGADLYKYSYTQRDTLIRKDGELLKQTFRTKTFTNATDLKKFIEAREENASSSGLTRFDIMAIDKAKKYEAKKYHADLGNGQGGIVGFDEVEKRMEERKATIENERKKLAQFLESQQKNPKPNQVFQVYYELKDSVVTAINYYDSIKRNALDAGDSKLAKECDDRLNKMLNDEKSWEYSFLVDHDSTTESRFKGANFVGRVQQVDSATFSRIRDFT